MRIRLRIHWNNVYRLYAADSLSRWLAVAAVLNGIIFGSNKELCMHRYLDRRDSRIDGTAGPLEEDGFERKQTVRYNLWQCWIGCCLNHLLFLSPFDSSSDLAFMPAIIYLVAVFLSNCPRPGAIPASLAQLSDLTDLDLSNNRLLSKWIFMRICQTWSTALV